MELSFTSIKQKDGLSNDIYDLELFNGIIFLLQAERRNRYH